jgi:hypothetical protein
MSSHIEYILIDPYVISSYDSINSDQHAENYVKNILEWDNVSKYENVKILISDIVKSALYEDKLYPMHHRLQKIFDKYNVDFADSETICRLFHKVLDRTTSIEDCFGVNATLYEDKDNIIIPEYYINRLTRNLKEAYKDTIVILSVIKKGLDLNIVIATTVYGECKDNITVEIEIKDMGPIQIIELPQYIEEEIETIISCKDYIDNVGIYELWKNSTDERGYKKILETILLEEGKKSGSTKKMREFEFGAKFKESLENWDILNRKDYTMVLIDTCLRIIMGIPKNYIRPFYENKDKTVQKINSNGSKAFRTHLTKRKAGYRLMLWEHPDKKIEFANVGDKDELKIF